MVESAKLKMGIDEFHFQKYDDYLDVTVDLGGYITLKTEMTGSFSIESQAELDIIYNKLKELLAQAIKHNSDFNKELKKKK